MHTNEVQNYERTGRPRAALRSFEVPGEVERADQLPTAAPAARLHAFGDDSHLVDAGAFGGVDDVDDLAVTQRYRPPRGTSSCPCAVRRCCAAALRAPASVTSWLLMLIFLSAE